MIDISGNIEFDAVRYNWGGAWRMPTEKECEELIDNCSYRWSTQNGIKGGKFTSKINGNSIFLPASGGRQGIDFATGTDEFGGVWSSTPSNNIIMTRALYFESGLLGLDGVGRYVGMPARPVAD